MPFYRVWEYPNSCVPYKHVYIKRDRPFKPERQEEIGDREDTAASNSASILKILDEQEKENKRSDSLSRSKRNITDLILCNQFDYFCTFTFDPEKINRFDYNDCQKKLRKFFDNFKQRYAPDFQYLIIPEHHKDGAFHFHGVCSGFPESELVVPDYIYKRVDGQYIPIKNYRLYLDWPRYHKAFGFFNCSKIRNYNACAFYVTKYVTKDLVDVGKGRAVYMCSQGLKRPELVYDVDDLPVVFNAEFENDYCIVGYERGEIAGHLMTGQEWIYSDVYEWEIMENISNDDKPFPYIEGDQLYLSGYKEFMFSWQKGADLSAL